MARAVLGIGISKSENVMFSELSGPDTGRYRGLFLRRSAAHTGAVPKHFA